MVCVGVGGGGGGGGSSTCIVRVQCVGYLECEYTQISVICVPVHSLGVALIKVSVPYMISTFSKNQVKRRVPH